MDLIPKMELGRFDTPRWLSDALVNTLPRHPPASVLDLGSGGGALSAAARRRWAASRFVTVDIDAFSAAEVATALEGAPFRHRHVVADALSPELNDVMGLAAGTVDVILSNPPYHAATWRPAFEMMLNRVGLNRQAAMVKDVTLDLIFLAQALYLVRPGGHLGLIVPDTLVTGSRRAGVRSALVERHAIERVVQLPRGAFVGTDAQAYILIIKTGRPNTTIRLDRVNLHGQWSIPVLLSAESAGDRLDHAFHSTSINHTSKKLRTIRDLNVEVSRGRASSRSVKSSGDFIFHTSNFPDTIGAAVTLQCSATSIKPNDITASPGDILIARVDRKLERKITIVDSGSSPISDCVFRLRCPRHFRQRILRGLCSDTGQSQLIARSRGVGARSITTQDILELLV